MNLRQTVLRGIQVLSSLVLAISLVGCPGGSSTSSGGSTMPPTPHPSIGLRLEPFNVSLTFPLFLTVTAMPGDTRLFVVEKGGAIKIVDRATKSLIGTFIDISNRVSTGSEQGLLGLAFDPQFLTSGIFYLSYTNLMGHSVIARFRLNNSNPQQGDPNSEEIVLTVQQPFPNHNGGMIAFGPVDNLLYIGLGDGGSANDPDNRAQNTGDLLGKLLRIDVRTQPYSVPAENPFVGQAPARPEIWSTGLRNPWRFSFDRQLRDLYIADVGQGAKEEVNASTFASGAGKGVNYGWKIMEGTICRPPTSMCNMTGLTPPVAEYDHSEGCSISGGYVYRGNAVPALQGTYFYADFCAGFVRSFRLVNEVATEHTSWPTLTPSGNSNITSFGEDAEGEIYIMTSGGGLYRIVPN